MENGERPAQPVLKKPSVIATSMGSLMQTIPGITCISLAYIASLAIGGIGLLGLIQATPPSYTSVVAGLVGMPIVYVLYNAPYNLVKVMSDNIDELRQNNTEFRDNNDLLAGETRRLTGLNETLSHNLEDMTRENAALAQSVELLEATTENLTATASRLKKTELGLQACVQTLGKTLIEGEEKQAILLQGLERVYMDMNSADLPGTLSAFMGSVMELDELTVTLERIAESNTELTGQLNKSFEQLQDIIEDHSHRIMNDKLEELSRWIRQESEGERGLRQSLLQGTLTSHECNIMLRFLRELDDILHIHKDIETRNRQIMTEVNTSQMKLHNRTLELSQITSTNPRVSTSIRALALPLSAAQSRLTSANIDTHARAGTYDARSVTSETVI